MSNVKECVYEEYCLMESGALLSGRTFDVLEECATPIFRVEEYREYGDRKSL